jgi:hypothetical protein
VLRCLTWPPGDDIVEYILRLPGNAGVSKSHHAAIEDMGSTNLTSSRHEVDEKEGSCELQKHELAFEDLAPTAPRALTPFLDPDSLNLKERNTARPSIKRTLKQVQ